MSALTIWYPAQPTLDDGGKPRCAQEGCGEYDGKRCRLMGFRPDAFCEPALVAIVDDWHKRGGRANGGGPDEPPPFHPPLPPRRGRAGCGGGGCGTVQRYGGIMSAAVSMKPSIQSRVHYEAYRAMPGDSITRLKELKRSPLHYRHALKHPKESKPLTFGKAIHVAVLEPERFDRDHVVWGERSDSGKLSPRNGKKWEAFASNANGREIITEDQYNEALAIQAAVRAHEGAMRYLASGDPEVTMTATLRGRICKGRADWLTTVDGMPILAGLKSARDCRPFIFGSAAAKLGYHLQWAFYRDIYEQATGRVPRVVEIVVESAAPYDIAVYNVPDDVMEQGREEYEALLDRLGECERDNHWPGAVEGEQYLTLPSWAYDSADDLTDLGLEIG